VNLYVPFGYSFLISGERAASQAWRHGFALGREIGAEELVRQRRQRLHGRVRRRFASTWRGRERICKDHFFNSFNFFVE